MQGQRGPDGKFVPVQEVGPLPDGSFVGGFPMPGFSPPLPPRPSGTKPSHVRSETSTSIVRTESAYLAQLPPAERSRKQRAPRTDPYLQFMVGPLLRYDTVDKNGLWHGAVMIVSAYGADVSRSKLADANAAADSGSSYEPHPILTYQWDPEERAQPRAGQQGAPLSFDLGPHPADPHSTAISPTTQVSEGYGYGDYKAEGGAIGDQTQRVNGQEIYVHAGNGG